MKVEVGQDATGRWAWMLLDAHGRLLASDDDYYAADVAMEAGLAAMKRRLGRGGAPGSVKPRSL